VTDLPVRTGRFAALQGSRPFRRYYFGQTVSLAGTWMQSVALAWLVLELTGSVSQVGFILAAQTIPVLLLGAQAGVLVDRFDTRRLLMITQLAASAAAILLGVLELGGWARLWMVYVLAAATGAVNALDMPARGAFVSELAPPELVSNAITLNSINMNAARVIGPGIGAAVIALGGLPIAFLLNGVSYLAVFAALWSIAPGDLVSRPRVARQAGQLREGLVYVWRDVNLRVALVMMTIIGTFTYEFSVTLPALAQDSFGAGASLFGTMTAAMGLGAVVGGLATASRPKRGLDVVARQTAVFGGTVLLAAAAPNPALAVAALVGVGAASLIFLTRANATVQLLADPAKRGRVMSLWTMAFLGTTPVGAPLMGFIAEQAGARWALVTGGVCALAASAYGYYWAGRLPVPAVQPAVA
jgi:MFS family permease